MNEQTNGNVSRPITGTGTLYQTASPLLFSEEIEKRIITAILVNNENYFSAASILNYQLFYNQKNAKVFKIIRDGIADGNTVDTMYVALYVSEHPDKYGYNMQDIMVLFTGYISDELFGQDVIILRDLAKRRSLWRLGQSLIKVGNDMSYTTAEAMKDITGFLENSNEENSGVISMKEANAMLMDKIKANLNGISQTMLATGFANLDNAGGFQLSDFDVIAADSSMGKTALAINIMVNIAKKGTPCMSYSMEMMAWQLSARINSHQANVPSNILQYKKLYEGQYHDVEDAMSVSDKLPIYFDDKSTTSIDAIIASIRLNAKKLKVRFFVIDYLQILSSVGVIKDEEHFLGTVARRLKNLAKELEVNITVLSQLSRNQQDPRPTLARVRASGQIVEAADTVLLIWRPTMYGKRSYKDFKEVPATDIDNTAEIIIAKGRNIGTGQFLVNFDPSTSYFSDRAENNVPAANDNDADNLPFMSSPQEQIAF